MKPTASPPAETEVLTVQEAAAVLRISRNAAYAATQEWRTTGGASGLPCITIGRTLRIPRGALDQMLEVASGLRHPVKPPH